MIRGEIWWADLGVPEGSEPGFRRPVLIIQENAFTKSRIGTIIVLPLTTNLDLGEAPGNVFLNKESSGLSKDSVINVSQISTLAKHRFIEKAGTINHALINETENGLRLVLGMA